MLNRTSQSQSTIVHYDAHQLNAKAATANISQNEPNARDLNTTDVTLLQPTNFNYFLQKVVKS